MPSFSFGFMLFSCVFQPIEFDKQSERKYNWREEESEAKVSSLTVKSSFKKIAQKVSPISNIQQSGEPGLGSFRFDK